MKNPRSPLEQIGGETMPTFFVFPAAFTWPLYLPFATWWCGVNFLTLTHRQSISASLIGSTKSDTDDTREE